jgi:hypothetical protein
MLIMFHRLVLVIRFCENTPSRGSSVCSDGRDTHFVARSQPHVSIEAPTNTSTSEGYYNTTHLLVLVKLV